MWRLFENTESSDSKMELFRGLSRPKNLAAIVFLAFVLLYLFRQIKQHRDIKKLGGHAPRVPSRLPFGRVLLPSHCTKSLPSRI